jgi:hypothetical protein
MKKRHTSLAEIQLTANSCQYVKMNCCGLSTFSGTVSDSRFIYMHCVISWIEMQILYSCQKGLLLFYLSSLNDPLQPPKDVILFLGRNSLTIAQGLETSVPSTLRWMCKTIISLDIYVVIRTVLNRAK